MKSFLVLCAVTLALTGVPFMAFGETLDASNPDQMLSTTLEEEPAADSVSDAKDSTEQATEAEEPASEEESGEPAVAALPAMAAASSPMPASETGSVGTLSVQISNDSGGFDDTSSLENGQANWTINVQKTLKVNFEFGVGTDKGIMIDVPTGYEITSYTATDSTPAISEVQNVSIDPEYKDFFQTSELKATDGSSPFSEQRITGFTEDQKTTEQSIRTYGGKIFYTFLDSATKGEIVVSLKIQDELLSHTAATETIGDIHVTMSSSAGSLEESFCANVTDIPIAALHTTGMDWGQTSLNVMVDAETGVSEQFGILAALSCWNNLVTWPMLLADDWSATITYPKGVSFDSKTMLQNVGIAEGIGTGSLLDGHAMVTVTGDKQTGGTVELSFHNTVFYHSSAMNRVGAYFVADTNVDGVDAGDSLRFTLDYTVHSNGKSISGNRTYERKLIADDGSYMIDIYPANDTHRNILADYPDFKEDQIMGRFNMNVRAAHKNVPLLLDFSDLRGVRSVALPGYDIRDISITTTNGRTIAKESLPGTSTPYRGVYLKSQDIGLADGEYIKTLSFTANLEQLSYGQGYNRSFTYCGQFVDNQEGDAVLSILGKNGDVAVNEKGKKLSGADHTTFGWESTTSGQGVSTISNVDFNRSTAVFEPNDTMYIYSRICGGKWTTTDCTTIIDPVLMISLPKGINLDTTSVTAYSSISGSGYVSLNQIGVPRKETIDGVEWTTYYFKSTNPMDLVALEENVSHVASTIELRCKAHVASNAPAYGQISLKDVVQWDLGRTMTNNSEATPYFDTHNRAGNGDDYILCAAGTNFAVKPLVGWNVDLGIRVSNSGEDFGSYDGTDASVTAVTPLASDNAEVYLSHSNTGSSTYLSGSCIYLPIPKNGVDYSQFFENKALVDPAENPDTATFEYTTYLASLVSLPGFNTYYAVNRTENPDVYDPTVNGGTWEPVLANWLSYEELIAAGCGLSDVVMLKFVSTGPIVTGDSSDTTFQLRIDENARIGDLNFWRAYFKGVSNADGSGVWHYSPVLAATPASAGITGQLFIDENANGSFDGDAADAAYTNGQVSAILSKDGGGMDNLALTMTGDGSFRTLNPNGSTYYLKAGDYTVTFTGEDAVYHFSEIAGSQHSDGSSWYNDIDVASIAQDEEAGTWTATYHFTIDADSDYMTYLGAALTDFVEVISVDVPVKVVLAVDTDGTWCTPTALDNKIINHSSCNIRVSSVTTKAVNGFNMVAEQALDSSSLDNAFAGSLAAGENASQDLTSINVSGDEWVIPLGLTRLKETVTDGSNELPLQLTGKVQNLTLRYLTAPVNAFDITYTFEKA